jgi:hypothetical protein
MRLKPSSSQSFMSFCGFVGKNNGGHLVLLATETLTIRVPDRDAELLEHCGRGRFCRGARLLSASIRAPRENEMNGSH